MLRKTVDPFTCLKETIQILARPGALLVTMGKREVPNVMAIGWGSVGIVWGKPVFVVLVRPSRYSFTLLKERGQFTVNLPSPELSEVVAYCGSVS
ncbi:MAG TPA: flavin reductase, partial [bacterium]|nr:flavin reductase [bacterium]